MPGVCVLNVVGCGESVEDCVEQACEADACG